MAYYVIKSVELELCRVRRSHDPIARITFIVDSKKENEWVSERAK